jgi:hypothetical protein
MKRGSACEKCGMLGNGLLTVSLEVGYNPVSDTRYGFAREFSVPTNSMKGAVQRAGLMEPQWVTQSCSWSVLSCARMTCFSSPPISNSLKTPRLRGIFISNREATRVIWRGPREVGKRLLSGIPCTLKRGMTHCTLLFSENLQRPYMMRQIYHT